MDDPDDPLVSEDQVPSFGIIEKIVKEIDNSIIIYRVYYFFTAMKYRFQLLKKDKLCIMDIPRSQLEQLGKDGTQAESQMTEMVNESIENAECWKDFEG